MSLHPILSDALAEMALLQPDQEYRHLQILAMLEMDKRNNFHKSEPLKKKLEVLFEDRFGLVGDRFGAAYKLRNRFDPVGDSDVWDHCTFYNWCGHPIVVTQPYWKDGAPYEFEFDVESANSHCAERISQIKQWFFKREVDVKVYPMCQWSFYYPRHASMILFMFPRKPLAVRLKRK